MPALVKALRPTSQQREVEKAVTSVEVNQAAVAVLFNKLRASSGASSAAVSTK
jgi:hypothetical protein